MESATGQTAQRLVVTSLGTAGFPVLRALEGRCPLAGPELAAVLYQAPGVLFPEVPATQGAQIVETLQRVGLEVELQPVGAVFTPGRGELDLSLQVVDVGRMAELLREVVLLLGVDGRTARDLLCREPCLLVGQVSVATALAIAARFDPAAARVVELEPAAARYDLYVTAGAPDLQRRIVENLRAAGHLAIEDGVGGGHLIVEGLPHATVHHLWEVVGQRGASMRIIPQALSRFELVLEAPPSTDGGWDALAATLGKGAALLQRVIRQGPVTLQSDLDRAAVGAQLAALTSAGLGVHAELLALQRFGLRVDRCPQPAAAAALVEQLTDTPRGPLSEALRTTPHSLAGPYTGTRARWLRHELQALGCAVTLVKHGGASP